MARIVMTTAGDAQGRRVLEAIHQRGITLDAVLVLTGGYGPPPSRWGKDDSTIRRLVRWPRTVAGTARRRARVRRSGRAWFADRSHRVVITGFMNGRQLRRDLERLAPDILVLGGGGILGPEIIATASDCVLNAHPALLPWARGNGVVGHSLAAGVAVGATVHEVDAGIDTGAVVARRLFPVDPGPSSLTALDIAARTLAAEMMADVVETVVRGGERPRGVPQDERFPLFRNPPPEVRREHEALAEAGRAGELFAQWRPLCSDIDTSSLPPTPFTAP